jgi:RNA polymerase sigma factor (sigma-70 family)
VPAMHQKVANDLRGTDVCAKQLQVTRIALLRYRSAMAGVARSMGVNGPTVEDVVHDAFEMACRKAEAERPDPTDESRFGGWLCTLARYAALTTRKDTIRNREISSPSEELESVPEFNAAYISNFDDKVAASVVFAHLNADDRALLHQHFFEDKTVKELAAERGIPWTTMRSRLDGVIHRARTIMDDKPHRRRGFGAAALAWLTLSLSEAYARIHASWSRSNQVVSAAALGFVTGGAVVVALLDPSSHAAVSTYASHASAAGAERSEAVVVSATRHVSHYPGARVPSEIKPCFASPASSVFGTPPITKPRSALNVARSVNAGSNDEERSRAMVPWGVSAVVRDDEPKGK